MMFVMIRESGINQYCHQYITIASPIIPFYACAEPVEGGARADHPDQPHPCSLGRLRAFLDRSPLLAWCRCKTIESWLVEETQQSLLSLALRERKWNSL